MKSTIPYIKVKGSAKERGFSHGSQCAGLIRKNIEICKSLCCHMRKVNWETLLNDVKRFEKAIRKYDPDLYIEMEAIAAGANVTTEEIIFLNVRTELMNAVWNKVSLTEGCTSIFVGPDRTADHKIYLAQTWDWIDDSKEVIIILHSDDKAGRQFVTVTEAGIIGSMGINNKGIAVLLNFLPINELNVHGTPYHLILRRVLESDSIFDAQRNAIRSPIAYALNVIIADSDGQAMDMELTANGTDLHVPENNRLVHTNHLLSDRLRVREVKALYQASVTRFETANEILRTDEKFELKNIKQLFSEHKQKPFEICKHAEYENDACTVFTAIFELKEQKLYLSYGLPCENDFITYNLEQLFE